jgi:hypothetical protein
MGQQASFHSTARMDFLGWRRRGRATEIVYDDGCARRIIWRVAGDDSSDARLSDALRSAVAARRVIPALYDELKKRAIQIDLIFS